MTRLTRMARMTRLTRVLAAAVLVALAAAPAAADLQIATAQAVAEPEPHVDVVVEVTRSGEPASAYQLAIGDGAAATPASAIQWRDPRQLQLVFVVDGSATLVGADPPAAGSGAPPPVRLHASSAVEHAIRAIGEAAGGSARSAAYGVVIVSDRVEQAIPLAPELPAAPLGAEADHAIDRLDITAGLRAAADALDTGASAGKRRVVVVIGMPRESPSREIENRLREAGIEVFSLEVGPASLRNPRALGGVVRAEHQFVAADATRLDERAGALGDAVASIAKLSFPVSADLFDGARHGVTVGFRDEQARANVDFPAIARPGRRVPWLAIAAGAAVVAIAIGVAQLLRQRRKRERAGEVATMPIEAIDHRDIAIPAGAPAEPEESETTAAASAPPPFAAWFYVKTGTRRGETMAIFRSGVTTLGRSSGGTHLNFDEPGVRARHAKVIAREGRVVIAALPAGETVRVAGNDVKRAELADGQLVELGTSKLLFKATR